MTKALRSTAFSVLFAFGLVMGSIVHALAVPQLLVDMQTGEVLYETDAGVPWHPASLTKLMTALLAFEAIEQGAVQLSTPVVTTANALRVAPSKMGFPVDTAITLEDALYLLIVKSANDIAVAIGETVAGSETEFVALMNRRAAEMGLTATHFVNPHGLHDPAQVTSARDMAIIALTIRARYSRFNAIFNTQTVEHGQSRSHTNNVLLARFAGTNGMKTGYVCASGLNIVATAERGGRHLMAVTLGASSARERGEMTAQLLFSGFAGGYRGTGQTVVSLPNRAGLAPVDMRRNICGADAAQYNEARAEEFPVGLEGQLSYLTDTIEPPVHRMAVLGRLRDVPLPRPRPDDFILEPSLAAIGAPGIPPRDFGDGTPGAAVVAGELNIPLPRPRPVF
nr:D-alanyl-D-alanine carboxypeptidase family protein [Pelagibacterium limicola]